MMSDFYILYKRNVFLFLFLFIVFMSFIMLLFYSRYNIIYSDVFDYRHVNSFSFQLFSILENSLFTFNILSIILTLFLFEFEYFNFLYFYAYSEFEIFLSKVIFIFIFIIFYIIFYFLFNLLLGVIFFDVPKSIYVYFYEYPISFFQYFIYSLKYYLALIFLLFLLSSVTLFFYVNFRNKIVTFLFVLFVIIGQLFIPKYSLIIHQINLNKLIITDFKLYLSIYFAFIVFFLFGSFLFFKKSTLFKIYNLISIFKCIVLNRK